VTRHAKLAIAILVAAAFSSCGREGTPTAPSGPTSFLTGTWRGTVTIQVNPGDPPSRGDVTWTFEVIHRRTCNRYVRRSGRRILG